MHVRARGCGVEEELVAEHAARELPTRPTGDQRRVRALRQEHQPRVEQAPRVRRATVHAIQPTRHAPVHCVPGLRLVPLDYHTEPFARYCGKQVGCARADEHVVIEVKDPVVSAQVVLDQRKLEKSQRMFQPCAVRAQAHVLQTVNHVQIGASTTSIRLKERARELCEWAGADREHNNRATAATAAACMRSAAWPCPDRLHGHVRYEYLYHGTVQCATKVS